MSFGGARGGGRKPLPPGSEFNWQKLPGELPDGAPTPTFPVCTTFRLNALFLLSCMIHIQSYIMNLTMPNQPYDTPKAEPLSKRERAEVNRYRALRDRFQNGPYYAVVTASSTSAKQGTKERAQFDPFHGMPSYSARYQKRKRTVPKIAGREYSESQKNPLVGLQQVIVAIRRLIHSSRFSRSLLPSRIVARCAARLQTG